MNTDKHVCQIFIKSSTTAVWKALTQGEFTQRYFHQTRIESSWRAGATVTYFNTDGSTAVAGEILESAPPNKLSFTWHVHYDETAKKEQPSRVTFLLESIEDATKLTVIHDNFPDNSVVYPRISEGWIAILGNLKTMLETDTVMSVS